MKKKKLINQLLAITLCIVMVLSLMPMSAYASSTSVPGAEGHILDSIYTGEFTGGYNSTIFVYATPGACESPYTIYNIGEYAGNFGVPKYDETQWYFAGWKTWYKGSHSGAGVDNSDKANPKYDSVRYYFTQAGPNEYSNYPQGVMTVLKETLWKGTYYLSAIYEPLVTVNAGSGVTYTVSGASKRADNTYSTKYSSGMTIDCTVEDAYYISSVSASYGTQYSVNGTVVSLSAITRPTSININTHLKQQKVIFDANGGEGTMAAQTFEHSVAQALTANNFTKTGYTFAGWNTKADGSGTGYADKESVSFTPVNDGDSITLYAQWTQCNDHDWENGECTKCGTLCSHFGGEATCTEQATCDICGEKYGSLEKHSVVYSSSNNRIVETCTAGCGHTATAELVLDTNVSTVYTGSAIEALKVNYSDNWQSGNLDIAYSDNLNVGTASGSVSISGATATQTFAITAAAMTNVSAQGYSGTYDGQAHGITVNAPEGATVSYKVGDGAYSAENPTFTNAGSYTVAYKVSMANYADAEGTATVQIDKAPLTVIANDYRIKYGEAPANNSVTCSGFIGSDTMDDLTGMLSFAYTYSEGDNVGDYEITPSGLTAKNYIISFESGTLTVDKATATCTAPTANDLTYNGQMQELVTAGTVNGGKMVFSFDKEGGYSETLEARNAGNYTVWYKVIGDANHNDSVPSSIPVEIKKATPDLGTVSADGVVNDTTKPEDVVLTQTGTVSGTFKLTDSAMLADKTVYNYTFTPNDSTNYNSVNGQVTIDVQDTVAPKAIISVDEHKWTFWDTITFGLFYNESKEVTITYADNENGSGLKDTLYYVTDKEMTADELNDVEWTAYTKAFDIDPDGKYVVYAKTVDNDGNMLVINSDGLVLDKTQAVVEGLTNGGAYYGGVTFTVTDALAGINEVTIDNAPATATEGSYTIAADNAEHTVVVTDNAGNVTEYKVTVYKNYTVTYKVDGEVISTQTVGHGKDATAPAIPEKEGYTKTAPVWDKDGKNITADTEINAIYTINEYTITFMDENGVYKTLTVKHGEKVEMPEVPAKEGYAVKWDTIIDMATGDATVNAVYTKNPAPSDTQSPQTGDNSNLWLWFVLLLVSGAGIFGITLNERKRKAASKR